MVNPWCKNSKEGAIALRAPPLGRPRESGNFYTKGKPNRVIVPLASRREGSHLRFRVCDAIAPVFSPRNKERKPRLRCDLCIGTRA